MDYGRLRSKLVQLFLGLAAVAAMAAPSFAVDYYLVAKEVDKAIDPDGPGPLPAVNIPMWGFALDPGGACWAIPGPNAARAASPACTGLVGTVPGPRLDLGTQSALRIFLVNLLPEHVSIVIPGQEMPYSGPAAGPTWTDGSVGPRTGPLQRVRSFGLEADPNGGRRQYIWTNFRNNPITPGTFLYHSGTHPQVQVQMGLYGAGRRLHDIGRAYPGVPFDKEVDLLFSEIDPALHQAVDAGTYGTPPAPTSTLDYHPRYFLVNGDPFVAPVAPDPPICLDAGLDAMVGDRILLRMMNAGLRELAPMLLGSYWKVVAEGGNRYRFPREQYSVHLQAGGTKDIVFTPEAPGRYWIGDRRLNLTNAAQTGGGFQTCVNVTAP